MSAGNDFFDGLESYGSENRPEKPIWSYDLDDDNNDAAVLKWLKGEIEYLKEANKDRFRRIQKNLAIYKGIQYQSQESRSDIRDRGEDRSRNVSKIVSNQVYAIIQDRVAKQIQYKPAVAIIPTNDEFEDKLGAQMCTMLQQHIWYNEQFEGKICPQIATLNSIMGEVYLAVEYNPDKGPTHPDYKKAKTSGQKVPLVDENGEPQKDESGNPIFIEKEVKVGDVDYRVTYTTEILLDRAPSGKYEDCNYIFERIVMPVEEARSIWKDKNIKARKDVQIYDYETMQTRPAKNEIVVWKFQHKKHKMMNDGRYIMFTEDAILENIPGKYSHDKLPYVRLTDIDRPGELHGVSVIDNIKGLLGAYNNSTNMILRNQVLCAHPKWMMPAGAAKLESLGNDITIVQFKGPIAPQLVQANPTPREIFEFRGMLKQEAEMLAGVGQVNRGEVPQGIESKVALQFISEMEAQRSNLSILKWNEFIVETVRMTLSVAGDNYDASDERTWRVMGKDKKWMSGFLDVAQLSKSYDVMVQNSSALPQSKAARYATLMSLNERFPEAVPAEQVLDMLEFAQADKFIDSSTKSVQAAEAENEQLVDPEKQVKEPEEWEDHIQHWKIHVKLIQDWSFKNSTPEDLQQKVLDHLMATEMLMIEKARKLPSYANILATLPGFPLVYMPEEMAETPMESQVPAAVPNPDQMQSMTPGPIAQEQMQLPQEAVNPGRPVSPEEQMSVTNQPQ